MTSPFEVASPLGCFESTFAFQEMPFPASPNVDSPENLVFGHHRSSRESSRPSSALSSSDRSSCGTNSLTHSSALDECALNMTLEDEQIGETTVDAREEKRRRNAEAASRSRHKKKIRDESHSARFDEMQQAQTRLQKENESLASQNRSLESQLSFFQNLFRTTMQSVPDSLPTLNDEYFDDCDSPPHGGGLELLASGSKRTFFARAVVLLAVFTIGSEDVLNCDSSRLAPAHGTNAHGRTLLWLDESDSNPSQNCAKLPCLSLWMMGPLFQSPLPVSSAATFACMSALRVFASMWFILLLWSALPPFVSWPRVKRGKGQEPLLWSALWRRLGMHRNLKSHCQ